MLSLLKTAREFEREYNYSKAVKCYEQLLSEQAKSFTDKMYVAYVRALNNAGDINEALRLLDETIKLFPNNEALLKEYYSIYDSTGDWSNALTVAEKLIKINPENSIYYFNAGRVFAITTRYTEAKRLYLEGLKLEHRLSFAELTKQIKMDFTSNPNKFTTEYIFINGSNNFGAFLHTRGDEKYFTKISEYNRGSKREKIFYKEIRPDYEELKKITPKYISSKKIGRLHYITIEALNGPDIDSENEDIKNVIDVAQKISKVDYIDIKNKFPNPNYAFRMRNRPNSILIYFTKIHEKQYNEKMFSSLYKLIGYKGYSSAINSVIKRVEKQIMENKLYVFMNPYKHYSLLHGDFIRKNLKLEQENDSIKVFDWGSFTLGPHFINIARYLTSALIPYEQIKKSYLFNETYEKSLTDIEKIFFLYSLIPFYILRVKEKEADQYLCNYILPAVEELELMVSKFMKYKLRNTLDLVAHKEEIYVSEINRLENDYEKLKKEHIRITTEKNSFEKQYKSVVDSKSWKITSPLRKIIEHIKALIPFKR